MKEDDEKIWGEERWEKLKALGQGVPFDKGEVVGLKLTLLDGLELMRALQFGVEMGRLVQDEETVKVWGKLGKEITIQLADRTEELIWKKLKTKGQEDDTKIGDA